MARARQQRASSGEDSMFEVSRRDVIIGAAGAYAAFGLDRPLAFIGAAQAQTTPAAPGFKPYKVGDLEVISLYDGVWEKPHDENFIKGANVEQTKAELKAGLLAQSMAAAGIDPKVVKTIVVSHFHGDHIFGLMARDTNAPLFPDAEIIVPAAELKWWTQPIDSIPQARRGNAQRVQATLQNWKNVKPVDGEADVAPGIRAIPAFGHTQGHTAHLISSGGKQLLVTADVTNIYTLFAKNPDWQAAFDHVPDQAVETRKKIFDRAIADKAMVAGYHWGLPNVGTIAKDGSGYAFTAVN